MLLASKVVKSTPKKTRFQRHSSTYPGFHVNERVRNSSWRFESRKQFVGDMSGLGPEQVVPGEGVQGEETSDVPDVRFEDGNVAHLKKIEQCKLV